MADLHGDAPAGCNVAAVEWQARCSNNEASFGLGRLSDG